MKRHFCNLATGAVAIIFATMFGHTTWSQTTRTIKIVVPVQPGGVADALARLLAEGIGRAQGLAALVENRPGAGGIIGTEAVARAAPDGNTLLIVPSGFLINPHLRKVNYDPLSSFEPICYLARSPVAIFIAGESKYHTLAEFLDAGRASPGYVTLAGSGPATYFHLAFEMLKRAAKVDMTFVPYAGGAPAVNALLGGHVTSAITDYSTAMAQLKSGTLRALVTTSRRREEEAFPGVPTIAEFGYQDIDVEVSLELVAPAKTPRETVSQLAERFTAALQNPEISTKLLSMGVVPVGICGADFGAILRKKYDEYGRIIREGNIKAE